MRLYLNDLRSKHPFVEKLVLVLGTVILILLLVSPLSATRYKTSAGDIVLRTSMDISWDSMPFIKRGLVILDLKPLVEFDFKFHDAPINLHINPETLNERTITSIVSNDKNVTALASQVQSELKDAIANFTLKSVFIAFLLAIIWALFNSEIISNRSASLKDRVKSVIKPLTITVSTAAIVIIAIFTWVFVSQESNPFSNYQIRTSLNSIENFNKQIPNLEADWTKYTKSLALLVKESYDFSEGIRKDQFPQKQTGILILSDIHNNTVLSEVIADKMEKDDIKAMIVAGDMTNTGTELESSIISAILRSKKPVYMIGGNHDSESMFSSINDSSAVWLDRSASRDSTETDMSIKDIEGVSIAGVNDPFFYNGINNNYAQDIESSSARLREMVIGKDIDILVVHNPKQAAQVSGQFPVIINGHTHDPKIDIGKDSIQVNPGTAGAIPPFYQNENGTYTNERLAFAVLYFMEDKPAYLERFFFDIKYGEIGHYSIEHISLNNY